MAFSIVFIRHGESLNNTIYDRVRGLLGNDVSEELLDAEERKLRSPDPGLTEKGLEQANRLGEHIRSNDFSFGKVFPSGAQSWKVFTSPMLRALQTTQAAFIDMNVRVLPFMYESGGFYGGQYGSKGSSNAEAVEAAFPGFSCEEGMEHGWYNLDHEESPSEFLQRAQLVSEWILARRENVIIVSHGNLMSAVINRLCTNGNSPAGCLNVHCNTGWTHLEMHHQKNTKLLPVVVGVNRFDHLLHHPHLQTGARPDEDHWIPEFLPLRQYFDFYENESSH